MKGLDVGFERMCKFGAGSMCAGNGKLRPAWSFWALLIDTPCILAQGHKAKVALFKGISLIAATIVTSEPWKQQANARGAISPISARVGCNFKKSCRLR